jgi:Zn-dependent peptidase ImmA (M78 family)
MQALTTTIQSARMPSPASLDKPWRAGYTAATRVREILGWADDDVPDLRTWLPQQGIALEEEASDTGWMCAVCTFDDDRARIVSNASYTSVSAPMRLASALGHLLLDLPRGKSFGVVSSPWAHWPATSRAKAFGAMLLMPDKAVRTIARTVSAPIDLVEKVIDTFRVGPVVATWHLYNLGLLGEEDRENALLRYESRSSRLQRSD